MSLIDSFENKVLTGLESCGVSAQNLKKLRLGAAVSGGADSVALLTSLCSLSRKYGFSLFVITVNHNIRSSEESGGDADFVIELCRKFEEEGVGVSYKIHELERGLVAETCLERNKGVEEAARYLRYQAFDDFIKENHLDFLCLAHNQNDQLETLLMRFLQGSGEGIAGAGIQQRRGFFIRPMLDISRNEIEKYLLVQGGKWRTDCTNSDDSYLRNNIRLNLIPLLDEKFAGWKKAVLSGAGKNELTGKYIESEVEKIPFVKVEEKKCFYIQLEDFLKLEKALQHKILVKLCNLCGEEERISFLFLEDVCKAVNEKNCKKKLFHKIEISLNKDRIIVKKVLKKQTDFTFSDIIEEKGQFDFFFGSMLVASEKKVGLAPEADNENDYFSVFVNGCKLIEKIRLPFYVRSYLPGDFIKDKNGGEKKLTDIFSDWKVPEENRCQIPVFQSIRENGQPLVCIFGKSLGFNNWIVK